MEPTALDPYLRIGAALLIGTLIGFERGWRKRDDPSGSRTAGLRTFSLIGLFGGVAGWLTLSLGPAIAATGLVGVAALAVGMYVMAVRAHGRIGATTEFAALLTYGLAVLAGVGETVPALAAAIVALALLDSKALLHGFLQHIHAEEFRAAIKLLLVSAVLLPILPDKGFGPGGVLNPYKLWWIVVLVAGLSLAGHFALRFAGPGIGPVLTGFVGGLISSTATTASASRLAAKDPEHAKQQAASVAAAKSVMCLRILVVAAALKPALLPFLAPPLLAATAAALVSVYLLHRSGAETSRKEAAERSDPMTVPDDLGAAIGFAAIVAAAIVATYYAQRWFGDAGLFVTAAVAGLVDVDAVTVTALLSDVSPTVATGAILLAAGVNSLGKIGIAASLGTRRFAGSVAMLVAAVVAAGAAGYVATIAWIA